MAAGQQPQRKQLSSNEKQQVLDRSPDCFICGLSVADESLADLRFDHIRSLKRHGTNELSNFAAVHKECHKGKGTKDLEQYKEELRLSEAFSGLLSYDDTPSRLGYQRQKLVYNIDYANNRVVFQDGSHAVLHSCPSTGLHYFYHPIPRNVLESDTDVQPRPLERKRLRSLTLGLRDSFQLSPAVCRLISSEGRMKLFDGQHKAVAQTLGNQRDVVDCKVFIDPPLDMVRRVVVQGHGDLRQQEFKTSELYRKLQSNYEEMLAEWHARYPDRAISETDLPECLGLTPKEANDSILAWIVESVYQDSRCSLATYISPDRRPGDRALTYDMFRDWVRLLVKKPPADEPMDSPAYLREVERDNLVRIANVVAANSLEGKWTPTIADAPAHKKARRIYFRASMREWSKLLSDVFRTILWLRPDEAVMYREIDEEGFSRIERACSKLFEHSLWSDPSQEVERTLNSNVQKYVRQLFCDRELDVKYLGTP